MVKRFAKPHPELQSFVQHYWCIEIGEEEAIPPQWIFPGIYCDLIIQTGNRARFKSGNERWKEREPAGFFEGHFDKYFILDFTPGTTIYGIAFKPLGVFPLMRTDNTQFNNNFFSLADIFGQKGKDLVNRICDSINFSEVTQFFDQFLLHLKINEAPSKPHIDQAFKLIAQSGGKLKISDLPKKVFVSERKLQRDFKIQTGMSPERMSKLMRFRKAMQILNAGKHETLNHICQELGYYDPSHFIQDMKKNSGLSLSALQTPQTSISRALFSVGTE